MKHLIEFNLPEDRDDLDAAIKAQDMRMALQEIQHSVFRPARKHGYAEPEIEELLKTMGADGHRLILLLEDKFCSILKDHGVIELL